MSNKFTPQGLKGFGIKLAVGLARYGLGDELLRISYEPSGSRRPALDKWRVRLVETVCRDPKGLIGRRNPKLARSIPSTFPDMRIYRLYRTPAIMDRDTVRSLRELALVPRLPDFRLLLKLCRRLFWWKTHRQLGQKMVKLVLPGLIVRTAIMAADFQAVGLIFYYPLLLFSPLCLLAHGGEISNHRHHGIPREDITRWRFLVPIRVRHRSVSRHHRALRRRPTIHLKVKHDRPYMDIRRRRSVRASEPRSGL